MDRTALIIGSRPPVMAMPDAAMRLVGKLGEFGSWVDAHRFAGLNTRVLLSMQQERYRSGEKMISELGISPKPIEESIESAHRWFKDNDYY